jgi:putative tricarboxylic transport membrane protein
MEGARQLKRISVRRVDAGLGAIVIAFGLFMLVQSLQLDFLTDGLPGPGFFPTLIALALALAGLLLTLTSLVGSRDSEEFSVPTRPQLTRSLSVWLATAGAVLLTSVVGFVLAMFVLAGVLVLGLEGKRNLAGIAVVILIPVLTYLFFSVLLQVSLPAGMFGS